MAEPAIDYNALMNAINNGYLDWDTVYKADWAQSKETQAALDYLNNNTIQLPTNSGTQRAWVKNMQDVLNKADDIGDVANSNTVGATVDGAVSGVTNFAKDEAGNITSTTGVVSASTGLAAAGNFVFGTVIPAVSAVAAGCALGKTIDSALYNASPDFWDSHNMSTLNPETWNEISRALEGTPGGFVFDMLFGTSPEGNTTQAYMDEQQLAYLAWYMQQNSVFDVTEYATKEGITDTLRYPNSYGNVYYSTSPGIFYIHNYAAPAASRYYVKEISGSNTIYEVVLSSYQASDSSAIRELVVFSDGQFSGSWQSDAYNPSTGNIWNVNTGTFTNTSGGVTSKSGTVTLKDGRTIYYRTIASVSGGPNIDDSSPNVTYNLDSDYRKFLTSDIIKIVYEGKQVTSSIGGVGTQSGATTPDLSNATSIATALELLKEQFPELWTNAVTNTVLQPDGALKSFTYVPVPTPDAVSALDPQPVTGPASQADPEVNPDTAPSLKDLITKILPKLDPAENKPGTGEGTTPTVVPQTGKASSLYSVYNPSQTQLNQFGAWLWSSDFFEQIKKLFNDPMQAIIGLHKVYSPVQTSGQGTIKCGYLDSGVPSNVVSEQYVTVDCGSVSLQEYFGNVFDYPPFTEISIYLPFIGVRRLDPSDVMRSTVSVKYHVDVFTGACLADVTVKRDTAGGVLYTFPGSCSVQYPLSSGSYMGIVSNIVSSVMGAISNPTPLGIGSSVANVVFNSRTNVDRSGSFTGNAGAMGSKIPYLIISRPQTAMAQNFETLSGYPSNTYTPLSACTGFTQVKFVHVENLTATDAEKQEIERLLKEGVII